MGSVQCYSMVRGSAIRVTGLDRRGALPDKIQRAVSRSVSRVTINEVVDGGSNDMIRSEETDERRMLLVKSPQVIRYTVDIDFIRVDPGILSLVAGIPLVYGASLIPSGFGTSPFGEAPFGGSPGAVVGFDARTRRPAASFSLEVWSRLANRSCANSGPGAGFGEGGFGEDPFSGGVGSREYGYTLFPYLRGGWISGFAFSNGAVTFNLKGAQTRRGSKWGLGPYDIDGDYERQPSRVSRNLNWRQMLVTGAPPQETCGIEEYVDAIDGGTATLTSADVLDGEFVVTSPKIVDGGTA